MLRFAIAQTCFAAVGCGTGTLWSLKKAAAVAESIGADALGAFPLRGSCRRPNSGKPAVPIAYVGDAFNPEEPGVIDHIMFPEPVEVATFCGAARERWNIPTEVHSPQSAAQLADERKEAWLETIPEKGPEWTLDHHVTQAREGGFFLAVDTMDLEGRNGLHKPFGDTVVAMSDLVASRLVRNIHVHPTSPELQQILHRNRGYPKLNQILDAAITFGGYRGLVTVEVGPFELWPVDPLTAIFPSRYLLRLKQVLDFLKELYIYR